MTNEKLLAVVQKLRLTVFLIFTLWCTVIQQQRKLMELPDWLLFKRHPITCRVTP